jgi:hypothetical protein
MELFGPVWHNKNIPVSMIKMYKQVEAELGKAQAKPFIAKDLIWYQALL